MEQCHNELLLPPEAISDDPMKLSKWQPRVRKSVNWEVVRRGEAAEQAAPTNVVVSDDRGFVEDEDEDEEAAKKEVTEPLTIGLIGQPNVGKSSVSGYSNAS